MTDSYICLCNAIKQSQIEQAIADGNDTMEKLQDKLEVNLNCGACEKDVLQLLNSLRKESI
jgi:bacterioferritin-associated ferredoxin